MRDLGSRPGAQDIESRRSTGLDSLKSLHSKSGSMNGHEATPEPTDDVWERSTAPQSSYTGREIGIGIAVFLVGALIAFGLPVALA